MRFVYLPALLDHYHWEVNYVAYDPFHIVLPKSQYCPSVTLVVFGHHSIALFVPFDFSKPVVTFARRLSPMDVATVPETGIDKDDNLFPIITMSGVPNKLRAFLRYLIPRRHSVSSL
jgi:hypothetical protein